MIPKLQQPHDARPLGSIVWSQAVRLVLVVLTIKVVWLMVLGSHYEMDSATYLRWWVPFHHPPLYSILLHAIIAVIPNILAVSCVQAALLAIGAIWLVVETEVSATRRYALAIMLGLEPATSFHASNLMSEALFVSLLMPWVALVLRYFRQETRRARLRCAVWLGIATGLLYMTRLVAVILPAYFILLLFLRCRNWKRALLDGCVMVLVFQASLVPAKLLYLQRYDTFSMSTFSGVNLWNNASPLYPGSSVRLQPVTEFERFLARRDVKEFTTERALYGGAIHEPDSAYREFVRRKRMNFVGLKQFQAELAQTSRRIILESPLDYVLLFVVPNFRKPMTMVDEIAISDEVTDLMRRSFGYVQPWHVKYRPWYWICYATILVGATVGAAIFHRRSWQARTILGLCWFYYLVIPWLAAVSIRYLLVLGPLIVVGAWQVATAAVETHPNVSRAASP